MQDWKLPWAGGCRCGKTRIAVTAPPLLASACHCTGCQKMTASAFSLTLTIPSDGFAVTAGEPVIGGLHGATRHHFCPYCMSWMFTRPEGFDAFVNLRPSVLDDHSWFVALRRSVDAGETAVGAARRPRTALRRSRNFPSMRD